MFAPTSTAFQRFVYLCDYSCDHRPECGRDEKQHSGRAVLLVPKAQKHSGRKGKRRARVDESPSGEGRCEIGLVDTDSGPEWESTEALRNPRAETCALGERQLAHDLRTSLTAT